MEAIAYYCGATVRYSKLTSCSARIIGIGAKSIITINSSDSPARRRFSVGHELGHWMHDRGVVGFQCGLKDLRTDWGGTNNEARANRFSSSLLMPRYLFEPRLASQKLNLQTIETLRLEFKTSTTATALRAVELAKIPAVLACYGRTGRCWFKRNAAVPFDVTPHYEVHQDAGAFDILFGASSSMRKPRMIDANKWLGHPAAARHQIAEQSIRVQALVLTLLTWHDQAFIKALEG